MLLMIVTTMPGHQCAATGRTTSLTFALVTLRTLHCLLDFLSAVQCITFYTAWSHLAHCSVLSGSVYLHCTQCPVTLTSLKCALHSAVLVQLFLSFFSDVSWFTGCPVAPSVSTRPQVVSEKEAQMQTYNSPLHWVLCCPLQWRSMNFSQS